jgi:hypothetical protein
MKFEATPDGLTQPQATGRSAWIIAKKRARGNVNGGSLTGNSSASSDSRPSARGVYDLLKRGYYTHVSIPSDAGTTNLHFAFTDLEVQHKQMKNARSIAGR